MFSLLCCVEEAHKKKGGDHKNASAQVILFAAAIKSNFDDKIKIIYNIYYLNISAAMIAKVLIVFSALSMVMAKNAFKQLLLSKAVDLYNDAQRYLSDNNLEFRTTPDYPYWNFMPQYVNALKVGAPKISWSTSCFANNEASVTQDGKNLNVEILSTNPLAEGCEDHYMTLCTSIVYRATPVLTSSGSSVVTKYTLVIPEDVTGTFLKILETHYLFSDVYLSYC